MSPYSSAVEMENKWHTSETAYFITLLREFVLSKWPHRCFIMFLKREDTKQVLESWYFIVFCPLCLTSLCNRRQWEFRLVFFLIFYHIKNDMHLEYIWPLSFKQRQHAEELQRNCATLTSCLCMWASLETLTSIKADVMFLLSPVLWHSG